MHVFVTGASGHIGSAVVPALLAAGHRVTGLARSEASASKVAAAGAAVHRGDLDDLDGLASAARAADGVIHLAFKHDIAFSGDYAGAASADVRAVRAIGEALAGSGKPFVNTAGTMAMGHAGFGRAATEDDRLAGGPRVDCENETVALAGRGVRSSVIRLAPTVHSDIDHEGFVPILVGLARKNGFSAYVGDGENRWPAVHTLDAADLYRLALESAPAGARLHGAAEEGIAFREIAAAIGRGLGLPTRSVAAADAPGVLGFLAGFGSVDNPTSSAKTRASVGWSPSRAGLLDDIAAGHYFADRA